MGMIWLRMLVATGIASLSASALASGALEVSMRYPADAEGLRIDRGKGVIEVVLTNRGLDSIDVSERSIPKPNRNGMLFDNFFDIRTDAGTRVSYHGIFVSWADIEGPYVRVRPREELVLTVDLPTNYRLEPGGSYEVKLSPVRYLPRARDHYALYSFDEVHRLMQRAKPARPLFLRIDDNARIQRQALEVEPAEECEDWQMERFGEARTAAKSQAAEAFAHYHGLFEDRVTPSGLVVEFNASARYTRWFGEDPPGAYWEWSEDDSALFATLLALPAVVSRWHSYP